MSKKKAKRYNEYSYTCIWCRFLVFLKKINTPGTCIFKIKQYKYDFKYMYHYYNTGALINISS